MLEHADSFNYRFAVAVVLAGEGRGLNKKMSVHVKERSILCIG